MPDEVKDPVVPVETPETAVAEPIIVNPREAVETAVITENNAPPALELETPPAKEEPKVEPKDLDQVERIKQSVQKRIDKVVAQKKSAEEELSEAKAEIARLKANPNAPTPKDDTPPTIEQVEAYILKMAEEGNKKEEIAATRYLIKLEKEAAIREVEDRQKKVTLESKAKVEREATALQDLAKDYIVYGMDGQPDMKSDLTLANQKGKLFQTAIALYNDPELRKSYYSDEDRALGFRRAVQDANRELHAQGLITPKVEVEAPRRITRQVLADPDAAEVVDTPAQSTTLLSDADKVREEIKSRNRMRNSRQVSK